MKADLLTVDEAYNRISTAVDVVGVERVFLNGLVGRVIAETLEAGAPSPSFDNSAMDGYAIRHGEALSGPLEVVGEAAAGSPFEGSIGERQAVRIFTGARVPDGVDTVVMQEHCDRDGGFVAVTELPEHGANIRYKGENIASGELILDVGDRITPGDLAILSSYQRSVVYAFRRPRVGIVSSGDELIEVDRSPGSGQIVNSNAYMLEGLVRASGGEPVVLPIARDTMSDTRRAFADALKSCDIVVSAGGVSVGDHDLVGLVIDELGTGDSMFWKVRMKPGKPLAFAVTEHGKPIIGLPGNPVSSFVGFHLFVAPAMAIAQGATAKGAKPIRVRAIAGAAFGSTPKRQHFVLGHLDRGPDPTFTASPHQSSGNMRLLRGPNAMADVPIGIDHVPAGSPIDVLLIS